MFGQLSVEFAPHQQALALRQYRQAVLATNIANADTPKYLARDFNFHQQLKQSVHRTHQGQGVSLKLTAQRHIPGGVLNQQHPNVQYRVPMQPSLDGNTVDMDVERVAFAENSMGYQSSLSILTQRIKTLSAALQS